jgi:hypothetical protein
LEAPPSCLRDVKAALAQVRLALDALQLQCSCNADGRQYLWLSWVPGMQFN